MRALLLAPERERLALLEDLLVGKPERASAVAEVLVEAILERSRRGEPEMARALRPIIEEALRLSVQRNPETLAQTLFPVFGPAIRRTISHALNAATEALNRTIDQTFTPRAVGWRWEAWRTGRSFGEIVLLRTLEYRVEQVYWIHRDTGLALVHERLAHLDGAGTDAGLVSAMLTAIRDFARDSFDARSDLDRFQLGELEVRVVSGAHSVLAAVVRGTPSVELNGQLDGVLEGLQANFDDELERFQGETAIFEAAREPLSALLVTRVAQPQQAQSGRPSRLPLILGAVLAVILGLLAWNAWRAHDLETRWTAFTNRLRAEPGIVITGVTQQGNTHTIQGLRDPLAVDPNILEVSAPGAVRWELAPFQSLDAPFVLARARTVLRPPASVRLSVEDGVLYATGTGTRAWLEAARVRSAGVGGVTRFMLRGFTVAGEGSP